MWPPAAMMPSFSDEPLKESDFKHDTVLIWLHGASELPSYYQQIFDDNLPKLNRNFDLFTPIA